MSRQPTTYWFTIPRDDVERMDVRDLLDMLRYDHAHVESNAPAGFYLFSIEGHEPEVRRWRSFGITSIRQWDKPRWQHSEDPFMKQAWDPRFPA